MNVEPKHLFLVKWWNMATSELCDMITDDKDGFVKALNDEGNAKLIRVYDLSDVIESWGEKP